MNKIFTAAFLFVVCIITSAQIPSVKLRNIEGEWINTNELQNNGKPFIISFFATWCKPCLRELNAISELYDDWRTATGVKLFAVSIDKAQNVAKVKPLADMQGWDYEVLLDPNSELLKAMGFRMVPALVVCDANGRIVETHNSYVDGQETEIFKTLKSLVSQQ